MPEIEKVPLHLKVTLTIREAAADDDHQLKRKISTPTAKRKVPLL